MTTDFKTELQKSGILVFPNKGVSMMPLLRQQRDLMVIKKTEAPFKKNQAVLFLRDDGTYVLHRIRRVSGENYYITGDNCLSGENVREEQILGVMTSVLRDGRREVKETDFTYRVYVFFVPWRRFFRKARHAAGNILRRLNLKK